ncbi:TPA: hypothetical protein ACH3X1_014080 [Trebouxia sp. C0004]
MLLDSYLISTGLTHVSILATSHVLKLLCLLHSLGQSFKEILTRSKSPEGKQALMQTTQEALDKGPLVSHLWLLAGQLSLEYHQRSQSLGATDLTIWDGFWSKTVGARHLPANYRTRLFGDHDLVVCTHCNQEHFCCLQTLPVTAKDCDKDACGQPLVAKILDSHSFCKNSFPTCADRMQSWCDCQS